ncbi:MAG: DUF2203 family protein [Planctomycetota bacterium]|jgi:hypothetical protein
MTGRLFTLDEANGALPLVRVITRDAVAVYAHVKALLAEEPAPEGRDERIARLLDRMRRLTRELEALGCRLRDVEKGVVDFPAAALGAGHFLYYSWVAGEDTVAHWRGEEEPLDRRHVVVASTGADS